MSARSSAHSALVLALVACGRAPVPEADPAKVSELAAAMMRNQPNVGSARKCDEAELVDGFRMTERTVRLLTKKLRIPDDPEHAEWINPPELDMAAARVLLDPAADITAQRRAAAELLGARFYLMYKIDNVNAPIAVGLKDPKIGTITARAIRYDTDGRPVCVRLFAFQNDKVKHDWAKAQIESGETVDPGVAKAMRDDLREQYLMWGLPIPRTTTNKVPVENI
jgi:hypothetical protein